MHIQSQTATFQELTELALAFRGNIVRSPKKRFLNRQFHGLVGQARAAASSILSSGVQGPSEQNTEGHIHSVMIARTTVVELERCLLAGWDVRCISLDDMKKCNDELQVLGQMLNRLDSTLSRKLRMSGKDL